jgi:excisionase family DNA binding protein
VCSPHSPCPSHPFRNRTETLDTARPSQSHEHASAPALIVPRLLRIQDAARYLSATTWFVETLIREKEIPSLVLGKRRVIDVYDLDAWIEKQKAQSVAKSCVDIAA